MPITPYTGSFDKPQLMHLLRRTLFGAKKADIIFFAGKPMDEVVTALLSTPALTSPINNYGPTTSPADTTCAYGETWVNSPYDDALNYPRLESFLSWWVGSMAYQERSVMWKMVMFWYNHVPVNFFNGMVDRGHESYRYMHHIQTYALGNFKDFIRVNATTYQMLEYLSGHQNTKDSPNENYGRELQELFTVGKDIDPHYTETDVREAARVMTGWRYDPATLIPYFNPGDHDPGTKTFSDFYGNTVIAGRTGVTAGEQELADLMDMIFVHPEVARYIVRKLYRYFVYYKITADVETNVIGPLADTFRSSGYDIKAVMRALLTSQHFYETTQMGCLIKSPLDYIVSLVRTFDIPSAGPTDYYGIYRQYLDLYNACVDGQMAINQVPSVAGWPAYYSPPSYHQLWINANTLRRRKVFTDKITSGSGYHDTYKVDALAFAATCANPSDTDALIDEVLELAHPIAVDATVKTALRNVLLSNQTDHYWTDAWTNYVNAPTNTTYASVVRTRLQLLFQTILDMAEFNLY